MFYWKKNRSKHLQVKQKKERCSKFKAYYCHSSVVTLSMYVLVELADRPARVVVALVALLPHKEVVG